MINRISVFAAMALMLAAANASAVTVVPVANNGTLTDSTYTSTTNNDLSSNLGASGYNFSGVTGSFAGLTPGLFSSTSGAGSAKGDFYAEYLITITGSTAQSVTTSLEDLPNGPTVKGVQNLAERIYSYNPTTPGSVNGFLGDASAPNGSIQAWGTTYVSPGFALTYVSPTALTAGTYVVELRGTTAGNFAGTLSIAPVPEPETYAMLLAGLLLLGVVTYRRKDGSGDKFLAA
ncbi:hypothetical protein AAKU67_000227 [Oxalobacteraceae bacterium GrIS 2.11]